MAKTQKTEPRDKAARNIKVVYRKVAQLKLNPRNPRIHSRMQLRQLARSMDAFGFCVPAVVDRDLNVIAGHGRILACEQLGLKEIPTISLDHLSEAQAKAFMIADNRLNENSAWDERLLGEQLKELSLQDLDFSIEATGFEIGEIDLRIEGLSNLTKADQDPADAIAPSLHEPVISKAGDLWLLGKHRVYCGSALDPTAYAALMDSKRAAMVFTDPPYNVPIAGHVSGLGSIRHREFEMASGEMTSAEFTEFLTSVSKLLVRFSAAGSIQYICIDWRHVSELLAAGCVTYAELKNICVWVKDNAGMGSFYRSQHEFVLVFKSGRARHRNNVQLGQFGRHRSNVWRYPAVNSFSRNTDEGNLLALHPTAKPVALVADAILDCTAPGDVVLDSFLGSGTTVLAAERTGRRCYGLEVDPIYVDTIVRRWQAYTGDAATRSSTGQRFNELISLVEGTS